MLEMNVKPKVAVVLPNIFPLGGAEAAMLALASQFLAHKCNVDFVLGWETDRVPELAARGARFLNLNVRRTREIIFPLVNYLRKKKPHAILVSLWPLTCLTIVAARLSRVNTRVITVDHNMLSIQYAHWGFATRVALRASLAATYRFADARVCVSSGVADDVARLSGIPRERFSVVHNPLPISVDDDTGAAEAEAAWGGWRGPRILTVGSLKAQKNHCLLVRAFKRLRSNQPARLMILGAGALLDEIRAFSRQEGLDEWVLTPGSTMRPSSYYRSADLFVLSSDYEGFGNVIVEALAHGLPVVSTDCPSGPADILENGRFGRLVPVGDEIALAGAMESALTSPHDPEPGKIRANDFSSEKIARKYLDLLFNPTAALATETSFQERRRPE